MQQNEETGMCIRCVIYACLIIIVLPQRMMGNVPLCLASLLPDKLAEWKYFLLSLKILKIHKTHANLFLQQSQWKYMPCISNGFLIIDRFDWFLKLLLLLLLLLQIIIQCLFIFYWIIIVIVTVNNNSNLFIYVFCFCLLHYYNCK